MTGDAERELVARWSEFVDLDLPETDHPLAADLLMQDHDVHSLVAIWRGQRYVDQDAFLSVRVNGFALEKTLDDHRPADPLEADLVDRYRDYADALDRLLAALGRCMEEGQARA